jgi:purine-cytosine permease-like protein
MISVFEMYLLVMLTSIKGFLIVTTGIIAVMFLVALVAYFVNESQGNGYSKEDKDKLRASWIRKFFLGRLAVALIFILLFTCFIPSTKQMAAILIIPKIANAIQSNDKLTEEVSQIPMNVVSLANDWIETLKPATDVHEDFFKVVNKESSKKE